MVPTLEDIIRMLTSGECSTDQALNWLQLHETQSKEINLDIDALGELTLERQVTVLNTIKKVNEQDQAWGPRIHPNFDLDLVAVAGTDETVLSGYYGIHPPRTLKNRKTNKAVIGELTWFDILLCELSKLTQHYNESDRESLRAQLIDVAGVAMSWAEALTVLKDPNQDSVVTEDDRRFGQPHYSHGNKPDHEGPGKDPM